MRRWHSVILLVFLFVFALSGTIFAASNNASQKQIGVFLLGDPSFRMADFYKIIDDKLKDRFPRLIVGDEVQSRYRKYYWNEKGLLKEPDLPTRQELFSFLKTLPYEQVLVLVILGPTADNRHTFLWYFTLTQSQANIQVRALLVDAISETVIADQEVIQKGPLSIHGYMSAKRGCFRKAMEFVAINL